MSLILPESLSVDATALTCIASFDIFETLLVRRYGDPVDVFRVLGRSMEPELPRMVPAQQLTTWRMEADRLSRTLEHPEVTLDTIYAYLQRLTHWDAQLIERIKARELEIEAEALLPIPGGRQILDEQRAAGAAVIFLSDMYLPSAFLRERLVQHGFWQEGDQLFVSGEWRKAKHLGDFFPAIAAHLERAPEAFLHFGNHAASDHTRALEAGWQTHPLPAGNLTHRETQLQRHEPATGGLAGVLAGTARLTRLNSPVATTEAATQLQILTAVACPLLASFALSIVRELKACRFDRVFLDRDVAALQPFLKALAAKAGLRLSWADTPEAGALTVCRGWTADGQPWTDFGAARRVLSLGCLRTQDALWAQGIVERTFLFDFRRAHGRQQAYAREDLPLLESLLLPVGVSDAPELRWTAEVVQQFAQQFADSLEHLWPYMGLGSMLKACIADFAHKPTQREAHAWLAFTQHQPQSRLRAPALRLGAREVVQVVRRRGQSVPAVNGSTWQGGSSALASSQTRDRLQRVSRLCSLPGRLKQRLG